MHEFQSLLGKQQAVVPSLQPEYYVMRLMQRW